MIIWRGNDLAPERPGADLARERPGAGTTWRGVGGRALAVAATSFVLPTQANAIYCGELDPACRLLCEIAPPCVR